jgi:CspA family cold shock protein
MPAGKVKWFNNAKGYGFVLADGSEEDLFVHYSSIQMDGYKTLKAGQPVEFDTLKANKGIHAVNVRILEQESSSEASSEATTTKNTLTEEV